MFKEWYYGINRLFEGEISGLGFPNGTLLEVKPSFSSHGSMTGMQRVLYLLQQYPGRFSFEIWKDKGFSFRFFTSSKNAEGMLRSQILSVYPQSEISLSKENLPSVKEGDYVSACSLDLIGAKLSLRCPGDFHYDPFRHVTEAMDSHDSRVVVQVLFERLRRVSRQQAAALAHKYGDLSEREVRVPALRCLIRVAAFSDNMVKARESMEHVARTFSVFDSDKCKLIPDLKFFPIYRTSYWEVTSMNRRDFPMFSDAFMVSVPELTSLAHLPMGWIHGVRYAQASLSMPDFMG